MKRALEACKRLTQLFFGLGLFDFPGLNLFRVCAFKIMFSCGKSPVLESHLGLSCSHGLFGTFSMGDHVFLGRNTKIDYSGKVVIEDDVWISENTSIYTHTHALDEHRINKKKAEITPTSLKIKRGCWIGANSMILESVSEIGEHSIVGAGSIVTKNISPYTVVGGNPAHIIKHLSFSIAEKNNVTSTSVLH